MADRVGRRMRGPYHLEAILWMNALVRDVRLAAEGIEPRDAISVERLDQWYEIRKRLERDVVVWEVRE